MKVAKLYYSKMCDRSKNLLDFMEENNIDKVEMMDATKDIKLQVEIYKLGGKSEVPMLYLDGEAIYDVDKIKSELNKL